MVKPPLLVATRSKGKQREIVEILAETRTEDNLEDAGSFEGNARRKVEYFAKKAGLPTAADDSGLEVFSLGGAPGVKSKRFAMPAPDQDAANNAELLRRLAGAPVEQRRARYRCSVVYLPDAAALPVTFEGTCTGVILEGPKGTGGFGYDPLFLSDELGITFGEASSEAKHEVSHRGRAFRAFAEWLEQRK
jgi:XTP/dITP diphosphohydrolase